MKDKQIRLTTDFGAGLVINIFGSEDQVNFKYGSIYREYDRDPDEDPTANVTFHNDIRCFGTYVKGILNKIHLTMQMTNVELRGKEFKWGVDVSPNSRLTLELEYDKHIPPDPELEKLYLSDPKRVKAEKETPLEIWGGFQLTQIYVKNKPMISEGDTKSPIKQIELPFQVKDVILNEPIYSYRVPFPHEQDPEAYFRFRHSILT